MNPLTTCFTRLTLVTPDMVFVTLAQFASLYRQAIAKGWCSNPQSGWAHQP